MPKGDAGYRHMTPEEERIIGLELDRDAIHRDWLRAERVVDAARALLEIFNGATVRALRDEVESYDRYLAAEKAEAERRQREPSGLPKRGLVSVRKYAGTTRVALGEKEESDGERADAR